MSLIVMEFPLDPPEPEDDLELIKEDLEEALSLADECSNAESETRKEILQIFKLLVNIKTTLNKYSYLST